MDLGIHTSMRTCVAALEDVFRGTHLVQQFEFDTYGDLIRAEKPLLALIGFCFILGSEML